MLFPLVAAAHAAPEMIPLDVFQQATAEVDVAPDIEIELREGGTFRLADQRGKRVLLSFWASWCAPCRKELPALSEFAKQHPDVVILAVNVDRNRKDAQGFLDKVHFDLPVAFDPDAKNLGKYGVISMPTMFLFDRKGALAWRHTGFSEEKGFTELEAALGGAK
ncbi:MAG: TlpA family protein disulfide reductase [Myxococcota bacterium]